MNSRMETADKSIFAIGECVVVHRMVWGLIATCYEMAEVLIANLKNGQHEFLGFDLSSKLRLISTDVASFGHALSEPHYGKTIIYEKNNCRVYKRLNKWIYRINIDIIQILHSAFKIFSTVSIPNAEQRLVSEMVLAFFLFTNSGISLFLKAFLKLPAVLNYI